MFRVLSSELIDFKTRRVAAFRKNLVELAELELKHAKVIISRREVPFLTERKGIRSQQLEQLCCVSCSPVHPAHSPAGEPSAVAELSGHPERKYITC